MKLSEWMYDMSLLREALTHKANERLEFLGDRVLELVVTEWLYKNYPDREGKLSSMRSMIVNGERLAMIAKAIGLDEQIVLNRAEEAEGLRDNPKVLEDALEAVIGAIYLDVDIIVARQFIEEVILSRPFKSEESVNHKGTLQEFVNKHKLSAPIYQTNEREHGRFVAFLYVGADLAIGQETEGKIKTEHDAARKMLKKLKARYAAKAAG